MKNIVIAKSILPAIEKSGTLFGRGGVKLHPAGTSEQVLDLHRRIKADLIITEYSLPVMNGAQLCSTIRAEPGLKDVSVIIACEVAELIIIPQRKDIRVLLRVAVDGRDEASPFFATSYNISVSGMLLETNHVLKAGDALKCIFNIAHTEISADCAIMRVDRTDTGRFRYGVRFQNLAARSLIIIEQYVKSRIK
jgi:CheY-like chemotaxis protein